MNNAIPRKAALGGFLVLALATACGAATQASHYTSEPVTLGSGGYSLNFSVMWTCDDFPQSTASAPGQIDLVDAGGNLAASLTGTVGGGSPIVGVQGAGTVSSEAASVSRLGAGGTPASGTLSGTWLITGLAPGAYTLRFWFFQEAEPGQSANTIWTQAMDAGGSAEVGGAGPTPTPTPAPAPSVSLAAPAAATALAPVPIGATATVQAGGNPLASVVIEVSLDGGATWTSIDTDSKATSPSDTESVSYAFSQAGGATVRATATDTAGMQASAQQTVTVAKANQPVIALSPPAVSLTQGQSAAFTASGGATGNYSWGGSASGAGPSQTVTFPSVGTYTVTAVDSGNATYNPSAPATATVSVQAAFYTLTVAATPGGTAAGGGSYPPNAQATVVATPSPGNAFSGWTGSVSGATQTLAVLVTSNLSVTANFTPLLPQTISFVAPASVTALSPPFALVASASSGLPVVFTLDSGPVALAANVVTPSGAQGTAVVTATQPGNAQYLAAPPVVISFPVGAPPPGVLLTDDSGATKRSDKGTRTTSFRSGAAQ